jgi:ABC-type bacteriocin/lantibiotic exporter with double-glycine peptidase domain
MEILQKIFSLLTPKERASAYFCFAAMLVMAIVEVVGVASIMPFMAVLADPDAVQHHAKLKWLYDALHFTSNHRFLIFLGFVVLAVLIVSNTISMLTTWLILRFTYERQYSLSRRLFQKYLYQPYAFFLQRNSSELIQNILTEVHTVVNRAFIPGMQLVAKLIVTGLILLLLLKIDPVLAFVLAFLLGGAYFTIYVQVRKKLATISERCQANSKLQFKIAAETFGGIKDIKLLNRENHFLQTFSRSALQQSNDEATGNIIAHLPRYALETIAFGGVLAIILYLLVTQKNISNAMPLLALYAFASFRLMPAMQQIFTSIAFLRISRDALNVLSHDLSQQDLLFTPVEPTSEKAATIPFASKLNLTDISFSYENTQKTVLNQLNLAIPAKATIGLVGMTGAGKSTIVDLILGLLKPSTGEMRVDELIISPENLSSWQQKIGYVPQMIFLADDTITNNIAFGIPPTEIDLQAVHRAARMANIHDFITGLELQYQTIAGDRGVRLSGGQRQRIGIARALYHDPEVLVLDEATSSLDSLTENVILEAIKELSRKKTIIIIAHRLTTLTECDTIHVLQDGKIISSDTYHELLKSCDVFREMAQVGA